MLRHKWFPLLALAVVVAVVLGLTSYNAKRTASQAVADAAPAVAPGIQEPSPLPRSEHAPRTNETTGDYTKRQIALIRDPEKLKQAQERDLAELERLHRAEPIDAAWKAEAETALAGIATGDALAGSDIAPTSYQNECRSRTCRVSANFDRQGDAVDWGNMFSTMSGGSFKQTRVMVENNPDGSYELRIYGARK